MASGKLTIHKGGYKLAEISFHQIQQKIFPQLNFPYLALQNAMATVILSNRNRSLSEEKLKREKTISFKQSYLTSITLTYFIIIHCDKYVAKIFQTLNPPTQVTRKEPGENEGLCNFSFINIVPDPP